MQLLDKIHTVFTAALRTTLTKLQIHSLSMEMSKLRRDGTAEPVSRGQILRREREQEILIFLFN